MLYVGIDLHKDFLVVAAEDERGPVGKARRILCRDVDGIRGFFESCRPFQAVIEASASYRWLYELLSPMGEVVLAHPLRLRAIVAARAKTDKLDAALLARLLRAGLIPQAYVPPQEYQELRDLTRARADLQQRCTSAKCQVRWLLRRSNIHPPMEKVFGKRGQKWLSGLDGLGVGGCLRRDELLARISHYKGQIERLDGWVEAISERFPQREALIDLYGMGLYTALVVIGELGEVDRFRRARQVGCYGGLTPRVRQSGAHEHHGHISKQGSSILRWALVQVAIKVVRRDEALRRFYERIRRRSGRNVARVAVARKLAGICWVRLMRWHREHGSFKEPLTA